jgi:hypothetical protein
MRLRIIVLLIIASCTVDKKQSDLSKELIGMWQDSPEIASGYTDYYKFLDNGDFSFNYNEMECDKRTIDYSGTWELINDSELKLTIKKKRIIVGGKLIPTEGAGSCASEFYIEGGELKTVELKDYEIQNISLSLTTIDREKGNLNTRTFDKRKFWKLGDDPASY